MKIEETQYDKDESILLQIVIQSFNSISCFVVKQLSQLRDMIELCEKYQFYCVCKLSVHMGI